MPPGGHIEPDEDPVQAVLREIEEESGLIAKVIPVQRTAAFAYPSRSRLPTRFSSRTFRVRGSDISTST